MTDTVREQLSALLDGELPDGETELLLKRLDRDPELRRTLSRYSLIGAALRTDGEIPAARAVAARVSAAVALEPALSDARVQRGPRWMRLAAGLSVAASVAVLAVTFGTAPARVAAVPARAPAIAAVAAARSMVLSPAATAATPVALEVPAPTYTTPLPGSGGGAVVADPRLARYLIAHADYATPLARRSLVSSLVATERPVGPAVPPDRK